MRDLPEAMVPVAAAYKPPPVPALDSATVVLVRDGDRGVEVYLLRRQATMEFAPGMYVFPGGGLQASDAERVGWLGPSPDAWADKLACDPRLASGLVVAAMRELFEEAGVLLAARDEGSLVGPNVVEEMASLRSAVERRECSFSALLHERGLKLRTDLLAAWAHWITPEFQPRRYDTRFFLAGLPAGQSVGAISGEADRGGWIAVEEALDSVSAGAMNMMPPTRHTCRSLVGSTVAELMEQGREREVAVIKPRLVEKSGRYYLDRPLLDEIV